MAGWGKGCWRVRLRRVGSGLGEAVEGGVCESACKSADAAVHVAAAMFGPPDAAPVGIPG